MSTSTAPPPPSKAKRDKRAAKPRPKPKPTARQEAVRTSMHRKKDWDDRVFEAMETAFDGCLTRKEMREMAARFLEPRHYSDIVDERVAAKLCGYPVCANPVQKLQGRYRISATQQKIYDITALKNFCSKECMAASTYLLNQLPLDPGYMRDYDSVFESLDILDSKALLSMKEQLDLNKLDAATKKSLIQQHIKSLISQSVEIPIPATSIKSEDILFDPSKLVIMERNVEPHTINPPEINSFSADAAEFIEGFRVTSRGLAITDMLAEYADRRKNVKNEVGAVEASEDTENAVKSETKREKDIKSSQSKKKVPWEASTPKGSSSSSEKKANDDEDENESIWLVPSAKSVTKALGSASLSLFGRLWNQLSAMSTSETINFIQLGPDSINVDVMYQIWHQSGTVDLDAQLVRNKIFSEKIMKCCGQICKRYRIQTPIHNDLIALLSTLYIRESCAMLQPIEDRIVSLVLFQIMGNAIGGSMKVEFVQKLMTESVVRAESGGAMTLAELVALIKAVS
ncbi:RNA polymerase II associated protein 2 [Chytriomyces hyalinus]|nr:RNA polymerase II associated protein 2 [Chytriomyces hyalinus]